MHSGEKHDNRLRNETGESKYISVYHFLTCTILVVHIGCRTPIITLKCIQVQMYHLCQHSKVGQHKHTKTLSVSQLKNRLLNLHRLPFNLWSIYKDKQTIFHAPITVMKCSFLETHLTSRYVFIFLSNFRVVVNGKLQQEFYKVSRCCISMMTSICNYFYHWGISVLTFKLVERSQNMDYEMKMFNIKTFSLFGIRENRITLKMYMKLLLFIEILLQNSRSVLQATLGCSSNHQRPIRTISSVDLEHIVGFRYLLSISKSDNNRQTIMK